MGASKRIGIITMHRVYNAGSALQAFALYQTIKSLGFDCEVIDYQYPNRYHQTAQERPSFLSYWWLRLKYFILYRSHKQHLRFEEFQKQAWESSTYYASREELFTNPPQYDLCITGSDQVWNPRHMKGDSVFFCAFSPNTPHIAYGSSFSQGYIPQKLIEHYRKHLSTYKALSVREKSGIDIITNLTGQQAQLVCDPTLLLRQSDYRPLIATAHQYAKQPYLLAYILDYAFNPYPTIQQVIDKIAHEKGLQIIYLMANSIDNYHIGKSITSAGPNEFLRLFAEASFVVTSSFHGVAFSLLFEKDFYTIIPSEERKDSRIQTLLSTVGATERAIPQGSKIESFHTANMDYSCINGKLNEYREKSLNYLRNAIAQSL